MAMLREQIVDFYAFETAKTRELYVKYGKMNK